MAEIRFGRFNSTSDNYFSPEYGGIDWRRRAEIFEADDQLDPFYAMGMEHQDDGFVQELTQENTQIRLNEVDPNMDMISIHDPRDGNTFVIFREQNIDRFEDIHKRVGRAVMVIVSRYPLPETVDIYLARQSTDITTDEALGE